jgi:diguanylate cyclase (GGDEF)-like protein
MSAPESQPSFEALLQCYLSAIQDIAQTVHLIHPEIGSACHEHLLSMRTRLSVEACSEAGSETLEEVRNALHQELQAFSQRAHRYEDALSARNESFADRLAKFSVEMEQAVRSADLQRLAQQAAELRDFVKHEEQANRDALLRWQETELLAYIDPLTGVANRREFDRQLAGRIAADRDFCILLFDLDAFKLVNDRFGHLCGDEVLKQLGARLARQVRSRDFVCRWGGDEFVAILECALPNAVARAQEIAQWLSGPYHVTVEGQQLDVEVGVSVGIAERVAGETPAQLFHRVDASLYSKKTEG